MVTRVRYGRYRFVSVRSRPDFILIRGGGVNQSITAVNSVNDRSFAFGGIGHLGNTPAQQGHFNTVVQFLLLHGVILPLSFMKHNVKGRARLDGRICQGYEQNS